MTEPNATQMLRDLIGNNNNRKSISKVEIIIPDFNEKTVINEATISHETLYTNIELDSTLLLCHKWNSINQKFSILTRENIENKLENLLETKDNYMTKKLVLNIFDNIIIFHALTCKIEELYSSQQKKDTITTRFKKINFASKNREYIAKNLSVLLENKKIFNIVWDILDN